MTALRGGQATLACAGDHVIDAAHELRVIIADQPAVPGCGQEMHAARTANGANQTEALPRALGESVAIDDKESSRNRVTQATLSNAFDCRMQPAEKLDQESRRWWTPIGKSRRCLGSNGNRNRLGRN
jgi:hypothetical protein